MFRTMGAGRQVGGLKTVTSHLQVASSHLARPRVATSLPSIKGQMRGHHISLSPSYSPLQFFSHLVVLHRGSIWPSIVGELCTPDVGVLLLLSWDSQAELCGHGTDGRIHHHPHYHGDPRRQPRPLCWIRRGCPRQHIYCWSQAGVLGVLSGGVALDGGACSCCSAALLAACVASNGMEVHVGQCSESCHPVHEVVGFCNNSCPVVLALKSGKSPGRSTPS